MNAAHEPPTEAWCKTKATELGSNAVLLVEGYEWTGVAVWRDGSWVFPPTANGAAVEFSWRLSELEDVRLFGDLGEWHSWRTGDGWRNRWVAAAKWANRIEREYVVWGNRVKEATPGWTTVGEASGVTLQVPLALTLDPKQHPIRLLSWHLVEEDPDTGEQYIADAMLRGLVQKAVG